MDIDVLAERVTGGDRRALAQAITLVESARPADREAGEALLARLLPHTGGAARLGLSGAPGAGKSTFIDAFGTYLIDAGHRVAVLAVDPSSRRSGGAIMGDKTRMQALAGRSEAFIRPSPSGETLGGVARRTREALLLVEAAGFDIVMVETVGIGQAETAVDDMVDMFILLTAPGGGDELQGIKRGVMELADLVIVTKADAALKAPAAQAASQYKAALGLIAHKHPQWAPKVLMTSALEREGLDAVWSNIEAFRDALGENAIEACRRQQAVAWLWQEIEAGLIAALRDDDRIARSLEAAERAVTKGRRTPPAAARELLAAFLSGEHRRE